MPNPFTEEVISHRVEGGTLTALDVTNFTAFPTVTFDGHRFHVRDGLTVPHVHMAYLARRGDAVAAELLDAFLVYILDADGKPYWPVPDPETV